MPTLRDRLALAGRVLPYLDWKLRRVLRPVYYAGDRFRCPICDGSFRTWATSRTSPSRPVRFERCPECDALPRMRALWIALRRDLSPEHRVLHVSPERGYEARLRSRLPDYVTLDLNRADVDVQASLTALPFDDERFERIICCDVLEHIEDDRAAMRELVRVLAPAGVAWIRVPLRGERTLEDPSVTDPAERDRLFGQPDHVRFYGRDVIERLEAAGFVVQCVDFPHALGLSPGTHRRLGLGPDFTYFVCRRRSAVTDAGTAPGTAPRTVRLR